MPPNLNVKPTAGTTNSDLQASILVSYTHVTKSMGYRQAARASPGSLLKMQKFRPHPRPAQSESAF